ncbi:MAG: hypothetical protein WCG25_08265 [bacterium]
MIVHEFVSHHTRLEAKAFKSKFIQTGCTVALIKFHLRGSVSTVVHHIILG